MRRWDCEGVKVQTCVTSPPYFGLRDYGHDGQIGLEETPDQYIEAMVEVFSCVKNILADDGTLWLNIGDSYAGNNSNGKCFKTKDLIGIPWMLAFALRADGWYLRQDIIWHKPNPMPESVTDRCTKAHEYIFLMSKSPKYYYDANAIKEASIYPDDKRRPLGSKGAWQMDGREQRENGGGVAYDHDTEKRNKRSVWTVSTKPYEGAHFAVFPTDLIEPCILAGAPVGGVVLDPFMGSGTTAQVAQSLGRQYLGCELNPEYAPLQKKRLAQQSLILE